MKTKNIELVQIDGYNHREAYKLFDQLTGLFTEYEIGQEFGTDCYDIIPFENNNYPTLEELQEKIKAQIEDDFDFNIYTDGITVTDVYNYLRRIGELPEMDILVRITY